MKSTRLPLLALLLLTLGTARTLAATPDQTASHFYRWYLTTLDQGKDPFTDGRDTLKQYVTSQLLRTIDKRRKSAAGLDADPFLLLQDWSKQWANSVLSTRETGRGPIASVTVIMQSNDMGGRRLRVTMKKNGDVWQIDNVIALKSRR